MITVYNEKINPESDQEPYSQDAYDQMIGCLQIHSLQCSRQECPSIRGMILHGSYNRTLKSCGDAVRLRIQRVKCLSCGSTHAILPAGIVPYSQIPLKDQCDIIAAHSQGQSAREVFERNPLVDENNARHIVRQYLRHWKERLLAIAVLIQAVPRLLYGLVRPCLSHYSRQFMQVHKTPNILFPMNNTALCAIRRGMG